MKATVSFYVRKSEAQNVFGSHFSNMELTEVAPATEGIVKQPLGKAYTGFNFMSLTILEGLTAIDHKFELRGNQYFLAVTFSNEGEQPKADINTYAHALCAVANNLNYRWQTAKYIVAEGIVNICSRERMNATKKDGTKVEMVHVR